MSRQEQIEAMRRMLQQEYDQRANCIQSTTTTMSIAPTEAAAVAEIVQRFQSEPPIRQSHENTTLMIWPKTQKIETLERFDAFPRRKRALVALADPASFSEYVRQHATERTMILGIATESGGSFRAVLDYHRPETQYESAEKAAAAAKAQDVETVDGPLSLSCAGWGDHVATYDLKPTPEWARWIGKNDTPMSQKDFAEFLEDNASEIFVPATDAAGFPNALQMVQVAQTFEAKNEVAFSSGIRLQNGQQQLTYVEKIDAQAGGESGKIQIPEKFAIAVSPFRGIPKYEVRARFKYSIGSGGKLTLRYQLERTHKVVEQAFADVQASIAKETKRVVLQGSVDLSNVGGRV